MNLRFQLSSPRLRVTLRTIGPDEIETLRVWKNAHRTAFFHQATIEPDQQHRWFTGYLSRETDYMFMAEHAGTAFGCLGFRLLGSRADIYNVMRGRPDAGGRGLMSEAMRLLCSYIAAEFTREIGAEVLRSNPARAWYRDNAFRETADAGTQVHVDLDWARFEPCEVCPSAPAPDAERGES